MREAPAPEVLTSDRTTVLAVYGNLTLAGARTLAVRLPDPAAAERASVVLRLRGQPPLGATAFDVLARYADRLAAGGGSLTLTGLDPSVVARFDRVGRLDADHPIQLVAATEELFAATERGFRDAEAWRIGSDGPGGSADPTGDDHDLGADEGDADEGGRA